MANLEQSKKNEIHPARNLERHLIGLHNTQQAVKDFRMHSRLGRSGIQGDAPLDIHANDRNRHEFASVARRYAEKMDSRRNPEEKMYADILGVIPSTVEALEALEYTGDYYSKDQDATLHMIEYVGVLRTIIDTNPSIQPQSIVGLVKSTALRYGYDADQVNSLIENTKGNLYGLKHELAFEATLYYLPEGFEILETTPMDDKRGIDYLVKCPNGVTVPIDVKASQQAVAHKADRTRSFRESGGVTKAHELTIFSGFTSEDFDSHNPWRAKPAAVERVYPYVEAAIRHAAGDESMSVREGVRL